MNNSGLDAYAPVILSVRDNETIPHRSIVIYGRAGPKDISFTGTITVKQNSFPETTWPVVDTHFKALLYLNDGANHIQFTLNSTPGFPWPSDATKNITINYQPCWQDPPLNLCILMARDSPEKFDAPPNMKCGLDMAIKKVRMMGYLWQAFTAEQMNRNGFGHRSFRLDEELSPNTMSSRDQSQRPQAKVHLLRSNYSLSNFRDPNHAQQNSHAKEGGKLFEYALEALQKTYPFNDSSKTHYCAVLLLDAHYDKKNSLIVSHAALGGGSGNIQLAIMGSHSLFSFPSCLEEIYQKFNDTTVVDRNILGVDCEGDKYWKAANVGIGAFQHEGIVYYILFMLIHNN